MTPRKLRRFKQLLPEEDSIGILLRGTYAVWAVDGDEGYPYAVPVNYVYCPERHAVYIHSARQGHKVDAIRRNPRCSLCVVNRDEVVPAEFTSYFRSAIAFGRACEVTDADETMETLRMLAGKYSPGIDPTAEIDRHLKAVLVVRVDLDSVSGKEAIELTRMRAQKI